MSRASAWMLAALLLAACGRDAAPPVPPSVTVDPHVQLQADMEKGTMDFSRVLVVRLQRDGKRLEVSSVAPAVVAESTRQGQIAKTIFRFNDKADGLTLFSRDLAKMSSFRTELALADLASRKQFSFPVVQPDGTLREQTFVLERIVTPQ